ncbi:deoxyribose-phosphate aldolase [Vallitalea okinawensis]|uniref:deoxyribose-phosphate aldolase n=1 Tax=Vallitalea okinawensis TaxID=2078660 RepID=UPI000CFD6AB3|nr:deoxyribose-phosphate aldolase [Vallitalea okinawensis]
MRLLTQEQLAKMIDQTELSPCITDDALQQHCEKSKAYGFKTVAINNACITKCKEYLGNSDVLIDAAISFPLGQCSLDTKLFETKDAIAKGAKEVDYVINIGELKNGNYLYIEKEMQAIVEICKNANVVSKVIFENCYLTDDEKRKLCEIALKVKPNYIKTSTGFGTGGATVEDVQLMKSMVGDEIKIKASGGVRSLEQAMAMIEAGASRIGTSKGIQIMDEYIEVNNNM